MKIINGILIFLFLPILSLKGYSQDSKTVMRLGIYAAETNNLYVDDRGSIEHWAPYLYLAPSFQIGRHEIYAGIY